jgi:methionyl-tRNA formyltransferase
LLKDESQIDWRLSAVQLRNKIHALNPAIGVSFSISREDGSVEHFKVWLAQVIKLPDSMDVATARCGQVIVAEPKQGLWIACVDTPLSRCVLSVLEIQKAGGKRVAIADALRGGLLRGMVGNFA